MKRTPYTAKDFAWVKMTPKQIQKFAGEALELKKLSIKQILIPSAARERSLRVIEPGA
jgi:hypothetical protein